MDKKQEYILIGIGVVVVLLIIAGLVFTKGGPASPTGTQEATPAGFLSDNPNALPTVQGGTREKVTTAIPTPDVNATSVSKDVAIPFNVQETGNISFRQFEIRGEGNQFVPDTIVVNAGDVIDLKLTAVDGDYNIFFPDFGIKVAVAEGQSTKPGAINFQAATYGQYLFSCSICRGTVTGTLIVNQK